MQFGTVGRMLVMTAAIGSFADLALAVVRNVPSQFPTIQAAINASVNGDEVVVAPGTYREAIDFLGKRITVRSTGGAAVTTIDAAGLDKSTVTFKSGENQNSILRGFTVTGGTGTLVSGDYVGGGAYLLFSSPKIEQCLFKLNEADLGGGFYADGATIRIDNCTFEQNSGLFGGSGGYIFSSGGNLTNSTFVDNLGSPLGSGGGLTLDLAFTNVTNCTFEDNTQMVSGGGIFVLDSSIKIDGCTFENNDVTRNGGAIDIVGFAGPTITNSTFIGNGAGRQGGAINIESTDGGIPGKVKVYNCILRGNEARADAGGGIYVDSGPTTVAGCTIVRNTADSDGGGVYWGAQGVDLLMVNCTVALNAVPTTSANYGGGIYGDNDPPLQVVNTIFSDNIGNTSTVFANIGFRGTVAVRPVVTYGITDGFVFGSNNKNADPLFVNVAANDFHILPTSPAIDAGDGTRVPADLTTDIDGGARKFDLPAVANTGLGLPPVDMGSDEITEIPPFSLSVFPTPRAGRNSDFFINAAKPNELTYLAYSTRGLGSTFVSQLNVTLDLRQPEQAGNPKRTDAFGAATITIPIPSNAGGVRVWFQAAQNSLKSNTLDVTVRNP